MTYDPSFIFKRLRDPFTAQKRAYNGQSETGTELVSVCDCVRDAKGSDIRMTIAEVAPAIAIGRRKETTGIDGTTF